MNSPKDYLTDRVKEFDLFWGLAPKGSLKYKKGQEIKAFLTETIQQSMEVGISQERERLLKEVEEKVQTIIAKLIQTHDCANDTACKFEDRLVKAQTKIGKALSDIGGKGVIHK